MLCVCWAKTLQDRDKQKRHRLNSYYGGQVHLDVTIDEIHITATSTGVFSVADPDLQIREGGGHPNPETFGP